MHQKQFILMICTIFWSITATGRPVWLSVFYFQHPLYLPLLLVLPSAKWLQLSAMWCLATLRACLQDMLATLWNDRHSPEIERNACICSKISLNWSWKKYFFGSKKKKRNHMHDLKQNQQNSPCFIIVLSGELKRSMMIVKFLVPSWCHTCAAVTIFACLCETSTRPVSQTS